MKTELEDVKKQKKVFKRSKARRTGKQLITGTLFLILLPFGWLYPVVGYFIPLCMLAGIGLAVRSGRTWCNWMCPRGSFADRYLKVISRKVKIPLLFKTMPLRLIILSFLMFMLTLQIIRLWPDPYAIGRLFVTLLTITTAVGVALAILFHQRTWCYICPIGTISSWVGKLRQPLQMNRDRCTSCGICNKSCPMDLSPRQLRESDDMEFKGNCLKCRLCVDSCPSKSLHF